MDKWVSQSCPTLQRHRLYSLWYSSGQNTGVGSLSLLQGIFPTQGSNPGLLHRRWILYQLSHQAHPLLSGRGEEISLSSKIIHLSMFSIFRLGMIDHRLFYSLFFYKVLVHWLSSFPCSSFFPQRLRSSPVALWNWSHFQCICLLELEIREGANKNYSKEIN